MNKRILFLITSDSQKYSLVPQNLGQFGNGSSWKTVFLNEASSLFRFASFGFIYLSTITPYTFVLAFMLFTLDLSRVHLAGYLVPLRHTKIPREPQHELVWPTCSTRAQVSLIFPMKASITFLTWQNKTCRPQFPPVHMPQPSRLYTPNHSSEHSSTSENTMFTTATVNDPSVDHITSLERALVSSLFTRSILIWSSFKCSNFTCCNIHLPDLHALIEHCEENHIPSRTRGSKPVFLGNATRGLALCTPPPSLVTSPSSSRSSSTVSSPMSTSSPLMSPIACDHDAHEHTPRCLPPLCSTMYAQIVPSDHQYPCGGLADLGLTRDYEFGDCYHVPADPYGEDSLTDALYGDGSIPHYGLQADISFPSALQSPAVIKRPSGISKGASRDRPGRSDSTSSNDGSPRKTPKGNSAKARIAGLVNSNGHGRRREKSFRCPVGIPFILVDWTLTLPSFFFNQQTPGCSKVRSTASHALPETYNFLLDVPES